MIPWLLDPGIDFLNHGSFGSCPGPVLDEQRRLQARMERDPVRFLAWDVEPLADAARDALASLLNADPRQLVFVPNATAGVNAVLRSLEWKAGDELLTTNHAYPACRRALNWVAERAGAQVVVAEVPFPIQSPDHVVERVMARVTPRTRLALIDHVTSPTGLVFPAERLTRALKAQGVRVLIDGAHAPGMIPVDLQELNADYYAGNCHKWLCSPKGAGFLVVRDDPRVMPTVISHGRGARSSQRLPLWDNFDWTGTHDPTPYLCVPHAIRFLEGQLPGGIGAVMARNRALALQTQAVFAQALDAPLPAPPEMIGSLASVPLPDRVSGEVSGSLDPLFRELYDHGFQVPVFAWPHPPKRVLRVSHQLYNKPDQAVRLATQLKQLLAR